MELKRPGVPNASVWISMSGSSTLCYTSVGRGAHGGSEVPTSNVEHPRQSNRHRPEIRVEH